MAEEAINLNIVEGEPFFAHELSVNFTPAQVILDFKCITPRVDPRSKTKPSFQLRHNCIMIEPWHAKAIIDVLGSTLKKYEEQYGKIAKPKALAAAEKKQKELAKTGGTKKTVVQHTSATDGPSYFG